MICCSQRKMTVILNTRENQGGIVNSDSIQAHYFHEHQTEREGERERGRERLRMNTCKLPKLPWKLQEEPEEQWRSQPKASYRSSQPQQEQCRFCHMGSRMLIKGDKSIKPVKHPLLIKQANIHLSVYQGLIKCLSVPSTVLERVLCGLQWRQEGEGKDWEAPAATLPSQPPAYSPHVPSNNI